MKNENQVNLDDLWQQQDEIAIDINNIAKMAKVARRKQILYMSLDIASLIPLPLLFLYMEKLTPFLKGFLLVNCIAASVMVAYFIKLRWAAVFSNHNTTEQYQQNLLQQLKNNAQIAFVNKHVSWLVLFITVTVVAIHGWLIDEALMKTIQKVGLSFAVASAILVPWWFWASKRQKRFETQSQQLQNIMNP